jgi:hypothetical protein
MSESLSAKDKIYLDPTDSEAMAELFSRLDPGDEVSGTFKATLDEAGQKMVVLSITEIAIDQPEETEVEPTEATGDAEPEESVAVKMFKNRAGVPENDRNLPPDNSMTH